MAEELNERMLLERPQLCVRIIPRAAAGGGSNAEPQPSQQANEPQPELAKQKQIIKYLEQQLEEQQQLNQQQQQRLLQQINELQTELAEQKKLVQNQQQQLQRRENLNQQQQQRLKQQINELQTELAEQKQIVKNMEHHLQEQQRLKQQENELETQNYKHIYQHREQYSHMRYLQLISKNVPAFREFMKMSPAVFNLLCRVCCPFIEKSNSYGKPVTTAEHLVATMRYLVTGMTIPELSTVAYIPVKTLRHMINHCCQAIDQALGATFMRIPNSHEEWSVVADGFHKKWGFPFCIGAIDGMHVRVRPAKEEKENYTNYKQFHSVAWLVLANADCEVLYSDVGSPGAMGDSRIFGSSDLVTILDNLPNFDLPASEDISKYVIVGDSAFPLSENLLVPFSETSTPEKRMFNQRLSRARQVVERTFGLMSNRFHIIKKNIHLNSDQMGPVLKACAILHNFISAVDKSRNNVEELEQRILAGSQRNGVALGQQRNMVVDVPTDNERLQQGIRTREKFIRLLSQIPSE